MLLINTALFMRLRCIFQFTFCCATLKTHIRQRIFTHSCWKWLSFIVATDRSRPLWPHVTHPSVILQISMLCRFAVRPKREVLKADCGIAAVFENRVLLDLGCAVQLRSKNRSASALTCNTSIIFLLGPPITSAVHARVHSSRQTLNPLQWSTRSTHADSPTNEFT